MQGGEKIESHEKAAGETARIYDQAVNEDKVEQEKDPVDVPLSVETEKQESAAQYAVGEEESCDPQEARHDFPGDRCDEKPADGARQGVGMQSPLFPRDRVEWDISIRVKIINWIGRQWRHPCWSGG